MTKLIARILLSCLNLDRRMTWLCVFMVLVATCLKEANGIGDIGVNWGGLSKDKLPPNVVVKMLEENSIKRIKMFDTDPDVLKALMGTDIEVMVAIPNEALNIISSSASAADMWVAENVTAHAFKGGANIRYVAVGNEPFLTSYKGQFQPYVLPAVINIQQALAKANLASEVKVIVPCNGDSYQADVPSQGVFRPDINDVMVELVTFLNRNGSPFVVNIYPFLSLYQNSDFPADYAFFENSTHPLIDGSNVYTNAFDGNYDTLLAALDKNGFGEMPIIIGEIGWPTDGAFAANVSNAQRFVQGMVNYLLNKKGTPLRPGIPPLEVYLFSLFDEDNKTILPGNFERHWGIFTFDGQAKYPLDLGQGNQQLVNAKNVPYLPQRWCVVNEKQDMSGASAFFQLACSKVDCTSLYYGGSCNSIGDIGNASYAFNSFYQQQNQAESSCDFDGLGMITFVNPSIGDCHFPIGIRDSPPPSLRAKAPPQPRPSSLHPSPSSSFRVVRSFLATSWILAISLLAYNSL